MKTEKEIRDKYVDMLRNTKRLRTIVDNPPIGISMSCLAENCTELDKQYSMNALIEWVLELNK